MDDPDSGAPDGRHAPGETRLLLDVMLRKLATHLRMCGYDAADALDRGVEGDAAVRALAAAEDRQLLTRDRDLAAQTDGALCLTATDVGEQLAELADAGFVLDLSGTPRCSQCNGSLERVGATDTTPADVPDPGADRVWRCADCGQHYWRGSHWTAVRERLPDE